MPPNDKPDADARYTLFTIADDIVRLRERVIRLKDPNCHAEYPLSRTRRHDWQCAHHRRRRRRDFGRRPISSSTAIRHNDLLRVFVGHYRYKLKRQGGRLKIAERRAILDAEELGLLGSVSFIL